jgi:hypothetical protein
MTATLKTYSDLCQADEQDGKGVLKDAPDTSLGLLSFYKGYENSDTLPRAIFAERDNLPQDVDLRQKYPKCFQQGGKEAIRSQGSCGSCWAFAGASAIMNTLCTSKEDSPFIYASPTDRFETSVQQIMSCNTAKKGCEGGVNLQVHTAIVNAGGISKERDHPYKCGKGDSANHMEARKKPCPAYPWGGTVCEKDPVPQWNYGGAFHLNGESQMMTVLSDGHSITVGMIIDWKFTNWGSAADLQKRKEVYTSPGPTPRGGHAMTGIGYGMMNGEKYWLIQNSWGTEWGDAGTIKVKRGINLHGIEREAFYFRSWVDGAAKPKLPKCVDGPTVDGLSTDCTPNIKWACKHPQYGPSIRLSCPVLCNVCPKEEAPTKPTASPVTPTNPPTNPTTTITTTTTTTPTNPPTNPPSGSGTETVRFGPSKESTKCMAIKDASLSQCKMTTPRGGLGGYWYHYQSLTTTITNGQTTSTRELCMWKDSGWTQDVAFTCEKPSDGGYEYY